jgi:hypothetical protein
VRTVCNFTLIIIALFTFALSESHLKADNSETAKYRQVKYTTRTYEEALEWQKDTRAGLGKLLKIDDLLKNKTDLSFDAKEVSSFDRGVFTIKEIEINSTKSRRIRILVTTPNFLEGPFPAVVGIGGHSSTRYTIYEPETIRREFNSGDKLYKGFGTALASTGYVTITTQVSQHKIYEQDRTLMGERLWDLIRCVDYLESMPSVDAKRIGCGGLSLGGEMTMWLAAMDERLQASVSCGFLTVMDQLEQGHCMCWKFDGLRELVDFSDIYSLTAPRALQCQNGLRETPNFFYVPLARKAMAELRTIYDDMNLPENVVLDVHEGGHEIDLPGLVSFFEKHLQNNRDYQVQEAAGTLDLADSRINYARELLKESAKDQKIVMKRHPGFSSPEAFGITKANDTVTLYGGGPAGILYGVQEVASVKPVDNFEDFQSPDFKIRGTVLFLMKEASYDYELTPEEFPWFYDKQLLTKYFDYIFENRFNAVFLWTGHLFPSIMEMPEYPDASSLTKDELIQNQEQFAWFTSECAKRNISVLLHFYNIHLPKALAKSRDIPAHYRKPDDFVKQYMRYTLGKFFEDFQHVGLYVCPGEVLSREHQPEWFRDVIYETAQKSGLNPLIVVRDWSINPEVYKLGYGNLYTTLKHNVEMIQSPVPDKKHKHFQEVGRKNIVNLHEISDIKPFRWGSREFIYEMINEWRKVGAQGAEVYGMVSWRWPYTMDKLEPEQNCFWPEGKKLSTLDRDEIWLEMVGRYLWDLDRDSGEESGFWAAWLAKKYGSEKTGRLLLDWYNITGPVLPGLQNLTSVANMNWWPTAIGKEQMIDEILAARKKPTGRYPLYPSQPVDTYFFEKYKTKYNMPQLENRYSMTVSDFAEKTVAVEEIVNVMTPDKVLDLLVEMGEESVQIATDAQKYANAQSKEELGRFVTDSEALVYITKAWRHKVLAAVEKRKFQLTKKEKHKEKCLKHLEDAVSVYEQLVDLTDKTYVNATDMVLRLNWHNGLAYFKSDLEKQKEILSTDPNLTIFDLKKK